MVGRSMGGPLVILLAVLSSLAGHRSWIHKAAAKGPPCTQPSSWAGIYPTVLTPLGCEGTGIDIPALEKQLRHELNGGVHGLLLLGTIGEGEYVSDEERSQIITTTIRVAGPHVPVVVGIHTCEVETARMQLLHAKQLGAAAVLVKYVGNPKATGPMVLGFFHVLAEMNVLPIFYYHFPSNTGLKLTSQEVAGILSLPGVVGIKESTLNLREVQAHIALTRGQGKTFLSGSALNLTQFMDLGGHGAMCPEGVLLPGPTVQAYHAYFHGQREEARSLQNQLFTMTPILRDRSTPAGITRIVLNSAQNHKLPVPMGNDHPQARMKGALNCLGVPTSPVVKCALPQLTAKEQERVQATVAKLQKIDWCEAAMKGSPAPYSNEVEEGGMLLKTGSFILGPNVGRDLLRSMSDGKSGF